MMALSGVRELVRHVGEELRLVAVGGLDLAALVLIYGTAGRSGWPGRIGWRRLGGDSHHFRCESFPPCDFRRIVETRP